MERARRHQRALARAALALLVLIAELAGRSLTHRLDVGRHVSARTYQGADYYPFLLAAVKVGAALMLARIVWRVAKARATERAAHRVMTAVGGRPARWTPRLRFELSPRLWFGVFLGTSLLYLAQTDAERIASGGGPVLAPWLHTSALPVFAVLSVLVAVGFRSVERCLADYERHAADALAAAGRLGGESAPFVPRRRRDGGTAPRRRFGLAFECRPPPVRA